MLAAPLRSAIATRAPIFASSRAFAASSQLQKFSIYRYDPQEQVKPFMQEYSIDLGKCGPMILDALVKIKDEVDTTLAFSTFLS